MKDKALTPQFRPRLEQGRAFGSYDPRTDGPPTSYDPDYEDAAGSAHIRPCPYCGAGTDESCDDNCPLVTGAPVSHPESAGETR